MKSAIGVSISRDDGDSFIRGAFRLRCGGGGETSEGPPAEPRSRDDKVDATRALFGLRLLIVISSPARAHSFFLLSAFRARGIV